MSRSPVQLRPVCEADAPFLISLWSNPSARAPEDAMLGMKGAIARVHSSGSERIIVAEVDGSFAGAIHLALAPLTPISGEMCVRLSHLAVVPEQPGDVVSRALVESAVAWAEEECVFHVVATSSSNNRDANRFLARLGLGQVAVIRVATTSGLRGRLPKETATSLRERSGNRQLDRVLAARRNLRRQRAAG
jgi:GNAT superfamily N-acetyltransferase